MRVFEIINNKPSVTIEGILTFNELYQRDTSKNKEVFFQELEFIYFCYDNKSFFKGKEKDVIATYIKIPNWKPDALVKKGIELYKQIIHTDSLGFLEDAEFACNKLREYWRGIDYTKRDTKGNLLYKPTEVSRSIKDSADMLDSIKNLKEKVMKEQELSMSVKGKEQASAYEFE
ncbi:MAG: hypothetical protein AABY22_21130 [Nanoarchaeota archaeon]